MSEKRHLDEEQHRDRDRDRDHDKDKDCGCKGRSGSTPGKGDGPGKGKGVGARTGGEIPWCRLIGNQGRKYTPWLLVRFETNDLGVRPLPANTVFWASPDIWVESSDPYGRPVVGQPNYVHARVFDLGRAPAFPTRVDFYWGNPALGLGASTMNLIGTEWVYIWDHNSLDVRCNTPWVPVFENGGHECLIVNTSAPIHDPIQDPFQAWLDRHVGQRNVMVVSAAPGQIIKIPLAAHNLFPMAAATEFVARTEHLAMAKELPRTVRKVDILNAAATFAPPSLNRAEELRARYSPQTMSGRLAATVAAGIADYRPSPPLLHKLEGKSGAGVAAKLHTEQKRRTGDTLGVLGHLFTATDILSPAARVAENPEDVLLHAIDLQPQQQWTLEFEVEIPANAREGEFVVTHVRQLVRNVPVGGYTILAAVGNFLEG